ncbi:ABC transporter substrate-binding protein [Leucobacter luti]|uniref:Amino acid ABC transporter substrate-binding protein (PAAT family) n=1 Tax=Leucobacter luti TaxID=340320 RepID=A0A4Q7U0C4_9MICO|nr:ABC transporter substrate-binding protein [Leucobacter luti]MBL3699341.1 ABC transporter substrate-binding protein [Leucobacter luti]RZT66851.1 amino acid ABC transporter substrate-binding protein (PAAT family) [Leucobacter luti]
MTITTRRRTGAAIAVLSAVALAGLTACSAVVSDSADGAVAPGESTAVAAESPFDLTSENAAERPRIDPIPEAVAALEASGFAPIQDGKLTVAHSAYEAPLGFLAEDDNATLLGIEPDIAQLVADGLGLEYAPENVAWADWPLGVESGKYDVVVSNVTVTEERKDLFDFATHRNDVLAFSVAHDSDIDSIAEAKDVSGLKVVVGSGTNQEKILLDWFAENEAAGLPAGEPIYYDDNAAAQLALASGRVDAIFGPNPTAAFAAAVSGGSKVVGTLNGGYPENAQIGVTTAKGNGLIDPVAIVLNSIIEDGTYAEALDRWDLSDEAVAESLVNPPGLPRP